MPFSSAGFKSALQSSFEQTSKTEGEAVEKIADAIATYYAGVVLPVSAMAPPPEPSEFKDTAAAELEGMSADGAFPEKLKEAVMAVANLIKERAVPANTVSVTPEPDYSGLNSGHRSAEDAAALIVAQTGEATSTWTQMPSGGASGPWT
jgi:hypothetical protein